MSFLLLTSSSLLKGATATFPGSCKPGCEEQCALAEASCFPCSWNNVVSFQMTGKRFQSEIMPRLVLFLTTPPVLSLAPQAFCEIQKPVLYPACSRFAKGFWKVPDKDLPWYAEIQKSFKAWG